MNKEILNYFNGDELATDVFIRKYKKDSDKTPDDMHKRMAKEFARIEKKYQLSEPKSSEYLEVLSKNELSAYGYNREDLTEEKIYNLFKGFKKVIPQGSVMDQLGNTEQIGSLSNCFVLGEPYDSYGGIMKMEEEMLQLMKRRGGVGIDLSTLRPAETPTTNAAKTSTGAVSFMHRFSAGTREIAQNGRRGALMLSMDVNHPDILGFVKMKRDLTKVTGANVSVKLNNEFMKAVENDEDYILRFPIDLDLKETWDIEITELNKLYSTKSGYVKYIKAKELWNEIIKSAHSVAEPGLMYWSRMIDYSPDGVYSQYRAITTNPCSEIGMQPYDACRLIAVNLFGYVKNPFTETAYFDFAEFYADNYEAMRLSDDLIDLELEKIEKIIFKIQNDPEPEEIRETELKLWWKIYETAAASRRTGLGFTGLADTLAALGIKYGSKKSLSAIKHIMRTKMRSELDCTIDLAILRGTFKGWDRDKEYERENDLDNDRILYWGNNEWYSFVKKEFPVQYKRMLFHGRRNVSFSTIAPTGSVSILAQVSSGIEPLFMPFYMRRKKVNSNDANIEIKFTDKNGDTWQEFPVLHEKFKEWILLHNSKGGFGEGLIRRYYNLEVESDLKDAFEKSPWYGATANDIPWDMRVKTQALLQKYISHSISSTVNLPSDVTEKEVSDIYMEAWKQGIKGITVYRDGSRDGVLVSQNSTKNGTDFKYIDAVKRPKELKAEAHTSTNKGQKYTIIVGLLDDKPYEVFIDSNNIFSGKGKIKKEKKGKYTFISDKHTVDISSKMTNEEVGISRLTSTSLRHGADIKFVVEQLNKTEGALFGFTGSLARVLKKYIPDGAKSTQTCEVCGSNNVVFEEGCSKCLDCGNSKCG